MQPKATPASQPSFTTIENAYLQRQVQLNDWPKQYSSKEKDEDVNRFAEAIFQKIKNYIEKTVPDGRFELPTEKRPAHIECTLESHWCDPLFIKQLKPDGFLYRILNIKESEPVQEDFDSGSNYDILRMRPNFEAIKPFLKEIGIATKVLLDKKLNAYQAVPGNKPLKFRVEWHDSEGNSNNENKESKISSRSRNNEICAAVWFSFNEKAKSKK